MFRLYLAIILKIFVRFTLKELDIISDPEERGMFELKMKNESKTKHQVTEFFHKQEEKRPFNNLTRNKTSRQLVFFS